MVYTYYAFISYNHRDVKWAKWLQRKLENYRLPAVVRKENINLPKKIYPIGRDQTDASSGVVWDSLKTMLDESQYLIVICSPNSANAEWVSREIDHFAETGRWNKIIPFVVDGEPHSVDPQKECFPWAIRKRANEDLLASNIQELGKRGAVLRVVAALLNLHYDTLVMRERKRTLIKRYITGAAAAVLVFFTVGMVWYVTPHSKYYHSYIEKYELPIGVNELTLKERKSVAYCYKIITRYGGRVERLERVNSKGLVVNQLSYDTSSDAAIIEYEYDDDRNLLRITEKDKDGNELFTMVYSDNLDTVDFVWPNDDRTPLFASADSSDVPSALDQMSKSETGTIARWWIAYNENGQKEKVLYKKNSGNQPACDGNGIYGKFYEYDEHGYITKITNLGKDEKPLTMQHGSAIAYEIYSYDTNGNQVSAEYYDANMNPVANENGAYRIESEYDKYGRAIHDLYKNHEGEFLNTSDGFAEVLIDYDKNGFLIKMRLFTADGSPAYRNGACSYVFLYNDSGRVVQCDFVDENVELKLCNDGYATLKKEYDSKGRITMESYYDCDGNPAYDVKTRAAAFEMEYKDDKNTVTYKWYDAEGNPTIGAGGIAKEEIVRDEKGRITVDKFYGTDGNPIRSINNYASIKYTYDYAGRISSISYYDENDRPCYCKDKYSSVEYDYDSNGYLSAERYYDADGNPLLREGTADDGQTYYYYEMRVENNEEGLRTSEEYYDADGNKVLFSGYAAGAKFEYDDRYNQIKITYFNEYGEADNCLGGYAYIEKEYNQNGQLVSMTHKGKDGTLIGINTYEYDTYGNKISTGECRVEQDGEKRWEYTKSEYNADNLCMKEYKCDEYGQIILQEDYIAYYKHTYDQYRNQVKEEYLGENDSYVKGKNAYTEHEYDNSHIHVVSKKTYTFDGENVVCSEDFKCKYNQYGDATAGQLFEDSKLRWIKNIVYDSKGNITECSYFDGEYNPIVDPNREGSVASKYKFSYNAVGDITKISYYDTNGKPIKSEKSPTYIESIYTDRGNICETLYYDENHELYAGYARTVYVYDESERYITSEKYYDRDDILIAENFSLPYIKQITDNNGSAVKLGLQKGDVFIELGDWKYFKDGDYGNPDFDKFQSEMHKSYKQNTNAVLVRGINTDSPQIIRVTVPSERLGINYADTTVSRAALDAAKAKYNERYVSDAYLIMEN